LIVAALTRGDIADFVAALITVYLVLILINIALSWVQQFRPLPYNLPLRAVTGFVEESTEPYLRVFRSFVPRIGPLDISPIFAILALTIGGRIVVGLIEG
jgi:YggT family protein